MKYIREHTYNAKRLKEVLALDALVYPAELQGIFKSVSQRYKRNHEMFIYALNEEDVLCGYICFFPLSKKLEQELIKSKVMFDDNIKAKDVVPYSKEELNHIFIISIVVSPKYQKQGIATKLIEEMFNVLHDENTNNYLIGNIYTTMVTTTSEYLFKKMGFT